ncbi:MAG TPA: cell division protein FtsW, partial [Rhodospirillaceae bacterium]|nr:cell division protein FtsW [Rhodospirillaceae bacterium]
MLIASRADNSWLGRWWFSVDRWLLGALMILICIGFYLVAAASPAVAIRIGAPPFHFIYNHLFVQSLGIIGMIAVSTFPPKRVRLLAILATVGILALLIMVPIIGEEIKGARRWIHLPGFSLQPSEFIKPSLAVVMAWLFARAIDVPGFRGRVIGIALYGVTVLLLLLQPDFGMTFLVTAIFGVQFFMTGIPYWLVAGLIILLICGGIAGYFMFPHFNARINKF